MAEIPSQGGTALFVHHDVTSEADWQAVVERVLAEHGRLDILVNNAGMGDLATIEETTLEDYERTIAIDQTGVFLGMKSCAEALKASGHGSVINISSIFGTSGGSGRHPPTTPPRARCGRSRRTSRSTGRPRAFA